MTSYATTLPEATAAPVMKAINSGLINDTVQVWLFISAFRILRKVSEPRTATRSPALSGFFLSGNIN